MCTTEAQIIQENNRKKMLWPPPIRGIYMFSIILQYLDTAVQKQIKVSRWTTWWISIFHLNKIPVVSNSNSISRQISRNVEHAIFFNDSACVFSNFSNLYWYLLHQFVSNTFTSIAIQYMYHVTRYIYVKKIWYDEQSVRFKTPNRSRQRPWS